MLVSVDPAVRIENTSELFTADVMDFWLPNYLTAALIDGQGSISAYLHTFRGLPHPVRSPGSAKFSPSRR
jgi:hydroxymethylglutaryl-CoA synthase